MLLLVGSPGQAGTRVDEYACAGSLPPLSAALAAGRAGTRLAETAQARRRRPRRPRTTAVRAEREPRRPRRQLLLECAAGCWGRGVRGRSAGRRPARWQLRDHREDVPARPLRLRARGAPLEPLEDPDEFDRARAAAHRRSPCAGWPASPARVRCLTSGVRGRLAGRRARAKVRIRSRLLDLFMSWARVGVGPTHPTGA